MRRPKGVCEGGYPFLSYPYSLQISDRSNQSKTRHSSASTIHPLEQRSNALRKFSADSVFRCHEAV